MDWEERWVNRDTPWKQSEAAPPLRDFLREHDIDGRVLVPGCGVGHEVALIANDNTHVVGLDISGAAIEQARDNYPLINGSWIVGDFFNPTLLTNHSFNWIFEHTFFCAIEPKDRELYAKTIIRLLKPKGHFLAIFFKNPDAEIGPPFKVTDSDLDTLFSEMNLIEKWIPQNSFGGREGREEMRLYQKNP